MEPAPTAMPDNPGAGRLGYGSRPDRRHVDPQILPALRRLDQDTAVATLAEAEQGSAHRRDPAEHPVRTFRSFHRQHMLARHDGGLSDVESRKRAQKIETDRNGPGILFVRCVYSGQRRRRHEVGREFMRAHDLVAALLQQHHGAAQHLIVASWR